jgi:hypothetical protein
MIGLPWRLLLPSLWEVLLIFRWVPDYNQFRRFDCGDLALYVLLGAGTGYEKIRALAAAAITALALYLAGRFLGAEPEQIFIDPIYLYPLIAGIVGYLAGRSRRSAFFAAVIGVFSLDVGQFVYLISTGVRGTVHIGGGGAFDSLILAGILAVLLAELIGEAGNAFKGDPGLKGDRKN